MCIANMCVLGKSTFEFWVAAFETYILSVQKNGWAVLLPFFISTFFCSFTLPFFYRFRVQFFYSFINVLLPFYVRGRVRPSPWDKSLWNNRPIRYPPQPTRYQTQPMRYPGRLMRYPSQPMIHPTKCMRYPAQPMIYLTQPLKYFPPAPSQARKILMQPNRCPTQTMRYHPESMIYPT